MDLVFTLLLGLAAFLLGAVPFSVIIGRRALHKDITCYGDGNPGASNVFRAGNTRWGLLAVLLDVIKGTPFVFISHALFGLPNSSVVFVAVCAVLGHAFSPFLRWHGGKAVAITFGVMLGLPEYNVLLTFIVFVVIGFFIIESDSWKIIFGAGATLIYLLFTQGRTWEPLLMILLLAILVIKHSQSLRTAPGYHGLLFRWVQTIIRSSLLML